MITPGAVIIMYDTKKYRFREVLCKYVFKVRRLEYLHKYWLLQSKKDRLNYSDNLLLRRVMQQLPDDSLFYKIYHSWVKSIIAPKYGRKISYSMHPKMRVHLSGTDSVSNFHRDVCITGREEQINVYLPFTDVFNGCTLWAENGYGTEKYEPLNLKYGQALIWDGGYIKHGTIKNDTEFTRVSCDFRFHYFDRNRVDKDFVSILSNRPKYL